MQQYPHIPSLDLVTRSAHGGGRESSRPRAQFVLPTQRPFTRAERSQVTILFGGVTPAHERLLKALLERRGFRVAVLATPTLKDYSVGRQYGNNGFCNPLYFTIGSLINYLRSVEDQGVPRADVVATHVYLTTSSNGPCRLGLYQHEYRHVLTNAGYGDVRVYAFEDAVNFRDGDSEEGMPFDVSFYYDLITALMVGDVLNDLYYRTLPYERETGATDQAWERSVAAAELNLKRVGRLGAFARLMPTVARAPLTVVSRGLAWLLDPALVRVLLQMRREFRRVSIDCSRVRPRVKLIGEFWAQTTQGDGNYRAQKFLHEHGAEVSIEPISTWVLYLLFEAAQKIHLTLRKLWFRTDPSPLSILRSTCRSISPVAMLGALRFAEIMYRLRYNIMRLLLNRVPDSIPGIRDLARLAAPYYNPELFGGEAHMEVGKTLLHTLRRSVHMVVSVKPFGCLPSTMSDGVQPLVRSHHPSTLFLSIETSSEGSTHAQSRMLMVLSEARERARREFRRALDACGLSEWEAGRLLGERNALDRIPGSVTVATQAARAVYAAGHLATATRTTGNESP